MNREILFRGKRTDNGKCGVYQADMQAAEITGNGYPDRWQENKNLCKG